VQFFSSAQPYFCGGKKKRSRSDKTRKKKCLRRVHGLPTAKVEVTGAHDARHHYAHAATLTARTSSHAHPKFVPRALDYFLCAAPTGKLLANLRRRTANGRFSAALALLLSARSLDRLDKLHVPETLARALIDLDRMGNLDEPRIQWLHRRCRRFSWSADLSASHARARARACVCARACVRVLFDCWRTAFEIVNSASHSDATRARMCFQAYVATLESRAPFLISAGAATLGDAEPRRESDDGDVGSGSSGGGDDRGGGGVELAETHVAYLDRLAVAYLVDAKDALFNEPDDGTAPAVIERVHKSVRRALYLRRRLYGDFSEDVMVGWRIRVCVCVCSCRPFFILFPRPVHVTADRGRLIFAGAAFPAPDCFFAGVAAVLADIDPQTAAPCRTHHRGIFATDAAPDARHRLDRAVSLGARASARTSRDAARAGGTCGGATRPVSMFTDRAFNTSIGACHAVARHRDHASTAVVVIVIVIVVGVVSND
jgi:hypothetical protein